MDKYLPEHGKLTYKGRDKETINDLYVKEKKMKKELEKDKKSISLDGGRGKCFDVEKEFFLITSDNLQEIETRFYGYSVQESGIYENDNLTEEAAAGLNGCGAYLYVEVKDGKIKIRQDFNGSYAIYLYRNGDYFALSNSFLRLLEYVKNRFPISLNRDYANCHLAAWYSNHIAYSDTLIQEIHTLERDIVIEIDIQEKELVFHKIDYKESSLWINSAEGLEVLDRWFLRWTRIFRKLKEKTDQIRVDLSGGFDTRIMFLLMLQSGIDLNEICVGSINDDLYTHREDYKIASEIADYYGFGLNHEVFKNSGLFYSVEDTLNLSLYLKMGFHKEMHFKHIKYEWKRYRISGAGGESVRAYYSMTAQEFKDKMCRDANKYSKSVREDMVASIKTLIDDAYRVMKEKHQITDDNSTDYPLYLFQEIDNRAHFGKGILEDYFSNTFNMNPYIDPDLLKLRLNDPECPDNNLLMAVMYVRYCPKLLDYRFARGGIDPETVEFAQKINEKFGGFKRLPSNAAEEDGIFHVNVRDEKVTEGKSASAIQLFFGDEPERYLKSVFDSVGLRKLFATCFDEEIYCQADAFYGEKGYHPMRHCYSVIAVAKAIEYVIASKAVSPHTLVQGMERYVDENYYEPEDSRKLILRLEDYLTARMDFQLLGGGHPDFEVVSVSDSRATVSMPEWIQKDGTGYMVESYAGSIDLSFRSAVGGDLKVWMRGRNVCGEDGNRIAYWIDYQNIRCNDNPVSQEHGIVWHDKPIFLNYSMKAGEILRFHAEWTPYRGDYGYTEEIKKQENLIKKQENQIKKMQEKLNNREKEVRDIKNSHTFRTGSKVLFVPKKIKNVFKGSK